MVSPLGEPELFASTLNSVNPPTVALSQALALLLPANAESWLGTTLNLTVAPTASASQRIVEAGPTSLDTQATALGLGFGDSRFLPSFFSTPGLTVISGGGNITGAAIAAASAAGNNDALVSADATNIGIANVNYLARSLAPLLIGNQANPFQANATASSRSLLPTSTQFSELPAAELQANATARGLEGSTGGSMASQPTFYGQPNAYVQASATLALDPATISTASASADAAGIENYTVYGGTNSSNGIARTTDPALMIGGHAAINWNLQGSGPSLAQPVQVSGNAIGIQQSTIYGAPRADTLITGSGFAELRSALPATGLNFTAPVQAIGINQSSITTGLGTTMIVGTGEAKSNLGSIPDANVAGIADTQIIGQGNTIIYGITPNTTGFNGILKSNIVAATGTTSVLGTAKDTTIATAAANTQVNLDGATGLSFLGGGGGVDTINLTYALKNNINAGQGNDVITIGEGGGNIIDGGFGRNLITSNAIFSSDTFVKSNAGAALDAASSTGFAQALADPAFWASLGAEQKQQLWQTGQYTQGGVALGQVDTISGFDAGGAGSDHLELSSSLGSLTQELWESKGAVFGVRQGMLYVIDGPPDSQLGVIVGSLADIRSLGMTGSSLAYASDTHQLLFDADGNWSQGSMSIGTVNMADGKQITKESLKFNA